MSGASERGTDTQEKLIPFWGEEVIFNLLVPWCRCASIYGSVRVEAGWGQEGGGIAASRSIGVRCQFTLTLGWWRHASAALERPS